MTILIRACIDHLPGASTLQGHVIKVHLLEPFMYDGGDFTSFPLRKGFHKPSLLRGDFLQHSSEATASLLQAWLFLGALTTFLGDQSDIDDFVSVDDEGQRTVSTKSLQKHLLSCLPRFRRASANKIKTLRDCLEEASYFQVHLSGRADSALLPARYRLKFLCR